MDKSLAQRSKSSKGSFALVYRVSITSASPPSGRKLMGISCLKGGGGRFAKKLGFKVPLKVPRGTIESERTLYLKDAKQ